MVEGRLHALCMEASRFEAIQAECLSHFPCFLGRRFKEVEPEHLALIEIVERVGPCLDLLGMVLDLLGMVLIRRQHKWAVLSIPAHLCQPLLRRPL